MHALSSFQRTDPRAAAFTAPAPSKRSQGNLLMLRASGKFVNHFLAGQRLSRNRPPNEPRLGEPYEDTNEPLPCQPFSSHLAKFFEDRRGTCFRRRQEMLRSFRSIGPPCRRWVTSEADRQYNRAARRSQPPAQSPGSGLPAHGRAPRVTRGGAWSPRPRSHDRKITRSQDATYPTCRILTTCRFRWPLRSTNSRPSIAWSSVTRPRSSATRPSLR